MLAIVPGANVSAQTSNFHPHDGYASDLAEQPQGTPGDDTLVYANEERRDMTMELRGGARRLSLN